MEPRFQDGDPKFHLRFGPMKKEQAYAQFLAHHDEDADPDVFLFVDIDRILNEGPFVGATESKERWEKSFRANIDLGKSLGAALGGMLDVHS